jgi:hypothetical protein
MPSGVFVGVLRTHRAFAGALAAAAVLRLLTMVAFGPALWFNDSFDYVRIGLAPFPHPVRPAGYGLLLWTLRPFHSFALVVALQHLMGLATAVLLYALLQRRCPRWAALLATLPVLFDAYQLELEQLIMSDVLFMFLLTAAVTLALWRDRVTWRAGVAIGLLLALATLTRTVGLPLVLIVLAVRRMPPRATAALVLAAAAPIGAYALWFQSATGHLALTNTDGIFLWGRTAAFADCAKVQPPPDLATMCPHGPPGLRAASSTQIWQAGSPTGWPQNHTFGAATNDRARRFALHAIETQPYDYASTVGRGLALTFGWNRLNYPTSWTAGLYRFPDDPATLPAAPNIGGDGPSLLRAYAGTVPKGRAAEPYAGWLREYQRWIHLRGTMLAALLTIGLAAIRRRRPGAALTWSLAAALLLVPLLTTDFDYRYLLPAAPLACAAAALTVSRRASPHEEVTPWNLRDERLPLPRTLGRVGTADHRSPW